MNISDRLKKFIDDRFTRMTNVSQPELKGTREAYHNDKDLQRRNEKERKKRERAFKADPNALERLRGRQYIESPQYEEIREKINQRKKDERELERKKKLVNYQIGKAHTDFHNFICMGWYLIKKETQNTDSDIFRWFETFLRDQDYCKHKDKPYEANDIKRIIYDYYYEIDSETKSHFEGLFNYLYTNYNPE